MLQLSLRSNIPLFEKARELGGRVIQQNGPIDHVCMADNCDNSYLKRHRVSVKNALNNKELPLFSTNQSISEC